MKRMIIVSLIILSFSSVVYAENTEEKKETLELESLSQRMSYAIGLQIGQSLSRLPGEFDRAAFDLALSDVLSDKEPRLSEEQMQQVFTEMQKIQQVQTTAAGQKNLKQGEIFLSANGKKEGITTTESGLQYKIIKEGDGEKPEATDKVNVHYRGTLISGKEFDSSYKRGKPLTFGVNRVIKGWTEGLQLMSVGSKYKFFIPSDLAYGERGAGADIGSNETLIFDVELLGIEK